MALLVKHLGRGLYVVDFDETNVAAGTELAVPVGSGGVPVAGRIHLGYFRKVSGDCAAYAPEIGYETAPAGRKIILSGDSGTEHSLKHSGGPVEYGILEGEGEDFRIRFNPDAGVNNRIEGRLYVSRGW